MQISTKDLGCEVHAESGERLEDCDRGQVVELLRNHGWLLFTGFEAAVDEFIRFSDRFGDCAQPRGVHYPPGGEALGFHPEDGYNPWRPDGLWFLCVFPGSDGGTPTGVVDGVRLLAEMRPEWREFCRGHRLRFDRHWAAETWQKAAGDHTAGELGWALDTIPGVTHRFLPDGRLHTGYEAPIVVRTPAGQESFSNTMLQAVTEPDFYGMAMADGTPVPGELIAHARKLALELEQGIGWRAGEVAVIDNHRLMHRRAEYHGKDRDLRARQCDDLFGSLLPSTASPLGEACKRLLQTDLDLPVGVGPVG